MLNEYLMKSEYSAIKEKLFYLAYVINLFAAKTTTSTTNNTCENPRRLFIPAVRVLCKRKY